MITEYQLYELYTYHQMKLIDKYVLHHYEPIMENGQ